MPIVFLGAANAAIVKLKCPRCGHQEVRARRSHGSRYDCRSCGHEFTLEEAHAAEDEQAKR